MYLCSSCSRLAHWGRKKSLPSKATADRAQIIHSDSSVSPCIPPNLVSLVLSEALLQLMLHMDACKFGRVLCKPPLLFIQLILRKILKALLLSLLRQLLFGTGRVGVTRALVNSFPLYLCVKAAARTRQQWWWLLPDYGRFSLSICCCIIITRTATAHRRYANHSFLFRVPLMTFFVAWLGGLLFSQKTSMVASSKRRDVCNYAWFLISPWQGRRRKESRYCQGIRA